MAKIEPVDDPDILMAALGRFVVDFEAIMETTRDAVIKLCNFLGAENPVPTIILMASATSKPLSEYFKGIAHHTLTMKHKRQDVAMVNLAREWINTTSKNLVEAGELRNQILHSTYSLSDFYGNQYSLIGYKTHITNKGPRARSVIVTPEALAEASNMMRRYVDYLDTLVEVLIDERYFIEILVDRSHIGLLNSIDFEAERGRIFPDETLLFEEEFEGEQFEWDENGNRI